MTPSPIPTFLHLYHYTYKLPYTTFFFITFLNKLFSNMLSRYRKENKLSKGVCRGNTVPEHRGLNTKVSKYFISVSSELESKKPRDRVTKDEKRIHAQKKKMQNKNCLNRSLVSNPIMYKLKRKQIKETCYLYVWKLIDCFSGF